MQKISKKLCIGIPKRYNQSINLRNHSRFRGFFEVLEQMHIDYHFFSENLYNIEDLNRFDALLFSSPRKGARRTLLNGEEIRIIRDYLRKGGKLLVLMRFSGDANETTNFGDIIPRIRPNDVSLIHEEHFHKKINEPVIDLDFNYDNISFNGKICYDSGCTFSMDEPVDFSLNFMENSKVINHPGGIWDYGKRDKFREAYGKIFILKQVEFGRIIYFGSRWSFSDEFLYEYDNLRFLETILNLLFPLYNQHELARRMEMPQRHRLLHAYPMGLGLDPIKGLSKRRAILNQYFNHDPFNEKPVALGIIPHPLCRPMVVGCGYCTFPHEPYDSFVEDNCINSVIQEITNLGKMLKNRSVQSIYLGGGTANLIKASNFSNLCQSIKNSLNISPTAEITFEGAPGYFNSELLDIFAKFFPTNRKRISLGIQTFDTGLIEKMGRRILNENIEKTLRLAKERGILTSADFLFNLPGQKMEGIYKDVDQAVKLQIPHICFYHLVCFRGLGTVWSKDNKILEQIPSNPLALDNWLKLYHYLNNLGYEPITVTDFKKWNSKDEGNYYYEEHLRRPENYDWIGCGSGGISIISDFNQMKGVKVMNPTSSSEYINLQQCHNLPFKSSFSYEKQDLQIIWLTRQLKGLKISSSRYLQLFGSHLEHDFGSWLDTCIDAGLIVAKKGDYIISPKGMFYSDSITGLLAQSRVTELIKNSDKSLKRHKKYQNDAQHERMG